MIVTVFRSRLNSGAQEEYAQWATRISELAKTILGYISHKGFVAEDGERVTIVEFGTEEACASGPRIPNLSKPRKRTAALSTVNTGYRCAG